MDRAIHKQKVGENLRLAREALGLSQQQMSERFDLGDKSKLSHWERGVNYPDPFFVYRLWKEEGITADWIYLSDARRVPAELAASLQAAASASPEASLGAGPKGRGRRNQP